MTSITLNDTGPRSHSSGSWANAPRTRLLAAVSLATAGVWVLVEAGQVRLFEANVAARIAGVLSGTSTLVWSSDASFYWGMDTPNPVGVRVTTECSMAYMAGALFVVFALLALLRRLPLRRVLGALAIATGLLLVVNQFRIALIAFSIDRWGRGAGFWWSHVVVGSTISVIGTVACLALAVRITFGRATTATD